MTRNLTLPGNPRYQPTELKPFFGYDNLYRGLAMVEIANLRVLAEISVIPKSDIELLTPELEEQVLNITTTEVDEEERAVTHHDVRAWVHCAQRLLPPELGRWVHVPLTSYDALDTGRIVQYVAAWREAVRPALREVMGALVELVREHAETPQIGRTHGQHALPITVGFWLSGILNRLLWCDAELERAANGLVGKITGAVGASNAIVGLGFEKRAGLRTYEERVMGHLGLNPAPYSTQILPPEPLAYFLFAAVETSAVLGQLGRDCRHLMRSEIRELAEPFKKGQVGSSTMAHKRNPLTFEGLEAAWEKNRAEFLKVLGVNISEHQRDLVGSAVMRDFPVILVNLMTQLNTMRRPDNDGRPWLARIQFDREALQQNFAASAHLVLAEPLYIALQMYGYRGDGHRLVSDELTPRSQQSGRSLMAELVAMASSDEDLAAVVKAIPDELRDLLSRPEAYTGKAAQQAHAVAARAEAALAA
jgi:adenylosuccinate lyase